MRIQKTPFGSNPFNKVVATLTAAIFLVAGISYAPRSFAQSVSANLNGENPSQDSPPSVRDSKIQIPPELGSIDEIYLAPTDQKAEAVHRDLKTVVYIQDAHDSLEAQENIAKIINHLTTRYGVKTVFEEGYEGPVPTDQYFGFIKDPALKQKVSYFFLDHLRLRASEYAHINRTVNPHDRKSANDRSTPQSSWQLIGADSLQLHRENIDQYRLSAEKKDTITKDLKTLGNELRSLADARFPKEFKEWLKTKKQYDAQKLGLFTYLERTIPLVQSEENDAQNNNKIHNSGRHAPFENVAAPLLGFLVDALKTQDPVVIEKARHIDAREVFAELIKIEETIAKTYLKDASEKQLFEYTKVLSLLSRLNDLQVTQEEYAALLADSGQRAAPNAPLVMSTQGLAEFIHKQTGKPLILSKQWENNIRDAIRFYDIAAERDGAISQALDKYFSETRNTNIETRNNSQTQNPNVPNKSVLNVDVVSDSGSRNSDLAILVYGGFHKENIKRMLEAKGIRYLIVSPRITKTSPRHEAYYKKLMTTGHHPFELPFIARTATAPEGLLEGHPAMVRGKIRAVYETLLAHRDADLLTLDRQIVAPARAEIRSAPVKQDEPKLTMKGLEEQFFLGASELTDRSKKTLEKLEQNFLRSADFGLKVENDMNTLPMFLTEMGRPSTEDGTYYSVHLTTGHLRIIKVELEKLGPPGEIPKEIREVTIDAKLKEGRSQKELFGFIAEMIRDSSSIICAADFKTELNDKSFMESKILESGWDQRKLEKIRRRDKPATKETWASVLTEILANPMRPQDYRKIYANKKIKFDPATQALLKRALPKEKPDLTPKEWRSLNRKILDAAYPMTLMESPFHEDSEPKRFGLTFSFKVRQTDRNRGILIKWAKGWHVKGVEGEDVVDLLEDALVDKGVNKSRMMRDTRKKNVHVAALVNDGFAILDRHAFKDNNNNVVMGVVIGNGTTGSIFLKHSGIGKRKNTQTGEFGINTENTQSGDIGVNTEWGGFRHFPEEMVTSFDRELDKKHSPAGFHMLEEMTAGMYVGELTGRILNRLVKDKAITGTREGEIDYMNVTMDSFTDLVNFLSGKPTSKELSGDARKEQVVVNLSSEWNMDLTNPDVLKNVKEVTDLVLTRAARILASVMVATLKLEDPSLLEHPCVIAVTGSFLRKLPSFQQQLEKAIEQQFKDITIVLKVSQDSGVGTAIAAGSAWEREESELDHPKAEAPMPDHYTPDEIWNMGIEQKVSNNRALYDQNPESRLTTSMPTFFRLFKWLSEQTPTYFSFFKWLRNQTPTFFQFFKWLKSLPQKLWEKLFSRDAVPFILINWWAKDIFFKPIVVSVLITPTLIGLGELIKYWLGFDIAKGLYDLSQSLTFFGKQPLKTIAELGPVVTLMWGGMVAIALNIFYFIIRLSIELSQHDKLSIGLLLENSKTLKQKLSLLRRGGRALAAARYAKDKLIEAVGRVNQQSDEIRVSLREANVLLLGRALQVVLASYKGKGLENPEIKQLFDYLSRYVMSDNDTWLVIPAISALSPLIPLLPPATQRNLNNVFAAILNGPDRNREYIIKKEHIKKIHAYKDGDAKNKRARGMAALALLENPDKNTFNVILNALKKEPTKWVKAYLMKALETMVRDPRTHTRLKDIPGWEALLNSLLEAAQGDTSDIQDNAEFLAKAARGAESHTGDEDSLLISTGGDRADIQDNISWRVNSISLLAAFDWPDSRILSRLEWILRWDPDPTVQAKALVALARLHGYKELRWRRENEFKKALLKLIRGKHEGPSNPLLTELALNILELISHKDASDARQKYEKSKKESPAKTSATNPVLFVAVDGLLTKGVDTMESDKLFDILKKLREARHSFLLAERFLASRRYDDDPHQIQLQLPELVASILRLRNNLPVRIDPRSAGLLGLETQNDRGDRLIVPSPGKTIIVFGYKDQLEKISDYMRKKPAWWKPARWKKPARWAKLADCIAIAKTEPLTLGNYIHPAGSNPANPEKRFELKKFLTDIKKVSNTKETDTSENGTNLATPTDTPVVTHDVHDVTPTDTTDTTQQNPRSEVRQNKPANRGEETDRLKPARQALSVRDIKEKEQTSTRGQRIPPVTQLKEPMVFVFEQATIAAMEKPTQKNLLGWLLGFAKIHKGMLHIVIPGQTKAMKSSWVEDLKQVTTVRRDLRGIPKNAGMPVFCFSRADSESAGAFIERLGPKFTSKNASLVDLDDGKGFVLAALLGRKVEELPTVNGFHHDTTNRYGSELRDAIQAFYDQYVVVSSAA